MAMTEEMRINRDDAELLAELLLLTDHPNAAFLGAKVRKAFGMHDVKSYLEASGKKLDDFRREYALFLLARCDKFFDKDDEFADISTGTTELCSGDDSDHQSTGDNEMMQDGEFEMMIVKDGVLHTHFDEIRVSHPDAVTVKFEFCWKGEMVFTNTVPCSLETGGMLVSMGGLDGLVQMRCL